MGLHQTRVYHPLKSIMTMNIMIFVFHSFPGSCLGAPPKPIEEILWWLPVDTQTVLVANQTNTVGKLQPVPDDDFRALARGFTDLGILSEIDHGVYVKPFFGQKVELAIQAGRRFRIPKGLGVMKYEGCQIFKFKENLGDLGARAMRSMLDAAAHSEQIEGHSVAVFEERLERDDWTFFLTMPRPDLLVCATHRGYLVDLLKRRAHRPKTRALPDHLPEWRFLDPGVRFWAVRHYDPLDVEDPSSPLSADLGSSVPDTKAIGLVVLLKPENNNICEIFYISSNLNSRDLATKFWLRPEMGLRPEIRQEAKDVIKITFTRSIIEEKSSGYLIFFLLMSLGHGLFL